MYKRKERDDEVTAEENTPPAKKLHKENEASEEMDSSAPLREILPKTTVADVLPWQKDGIPMVIESNKSFIEGIQILMDNKILSAPIYDPTNKKYLGFVDVVDYVAGFIKIAESFGDTASKKADDNDLDDEDEERKELEEDFLMSDTAVTAVADVSHRDKFIQVSKTDTLDHIASLLMENHRVAVMDGEELIGVITQSGFVEYLLDNFAENMQKQFEKLKLKEILPKLPKQVHSVKDSERVLDGFRMIRDRKVSGLAVVNDSGILTDVLSATDLVLWNEWVIEGAKMRFSNLSALRNTVKKFLDETRSRRGTVGLSKSPVTCDEETNVLDATSQMLSQNVHRMFVLPKEGPRVPTSVLVYADLIKLFAH